MLHARGWSLAGAQIATGINRGTINNMRQGIPPSAQMVARWARAIHEDVGHWLDVAGHVEAVELIAGRAGSPQAPESPQIATESPPGPGAAQADVTHYNPLGDELAGDYSHLDDEDRRLVDDMIRRLAGKRTG